MKIVRGAALAAVLLLTNAWNAVYAENAASSDTLQAARELVALISKDTISQMVTQLTSRIWPQIEQTLKSKQQVSSDQLADLRHEYERIQFDFVSKVMVDAPSIYPKYYRATELHELLAFYRTPVGAKSLRVMPQIAGKSMGLVLPRVRQLQMEVIQAFAKVARSRGLNI